MANTVEGRVNIKVNVDGNATQSLDNIYSKFKELQKNVISITDSINENTVRSKGNYADYERLLGGIITKYKELANEVGKLSAGDISGLDTINSKMRAIQTNLAQLQNTQIITSPEVARAQELKEIVTQLKARLTEARENYNSFMNNNGLVSPQQQSTNISNYIRLLEQSKQYAKPDSVDSIDKLIAKLKEELEETNKNIEATKSLNGELDKLFGSDKSKEIDFDKINFSLDNGQENVDGISDAFNRLEESSKNSSVSINDILTTLSQSGGKIGKTASMIQKFGTEAGKVAGYAAVLGVELKVLKTMWDTFNKTVKDAEQDIINVGKAVLNLTKSLSINAIGGLRDLTVNGVKELGDAFNDLVNDIQNIVSALSELSEKGMEVNDALFVMSNYLGNEAAEQLNTYYEALGQLKGIDITKTEQSLKGLFGSLSNMNLDSGQMVEYAKAFSGFMNDLSVYQGVDISSISSQLEAAVSFGTLNVRSPLARSLDITKEMVDQFKELGTVEERAQWILNRWPIFAGKYDEWLQTDQGKVQVLKNTWENFMNTVGQLALRIYAIVAPILTNLINLANTVVSAVSGFFGVKAAVDTSSINSASGAIGDLGDSYEEAGKKAAKSSKQVLSFDDVIQINKDSGAGAGGAGAGASAGGLSNELLGLLGDLDKNRTKFDEYLEKIKEAIEKEQFFEAGYIAAQALDYLLTSINWDEVYSKIEKYSKGLAQFLNGFNSNKKLWLDMGQTVGKSLNAVSLAVKTFFKEFDGTNFGNSLTLMLRSIIDSFDEKQAADAIYEVLKDIFQIASELINSDLISDVARKLTYLIEDLFKDINNDGGGEKAADALFSFFKQAFLAVGNMIVSLTNDEDTKQVVRDFFSTLLKDFADNGQTFAVDLGTIISNMFNFLKENIFTEENIQNFVIGITDFVNQIIEDLPSIIESIFTFLSENILTEENIKRVVDTIHNLATMLSENSEEIGQAMKPVFDAITNVIYQLRTDGTLTKINDAIMTIIEESGIIDLISEWAGMKLQALGLILWDKIKIWIQERVKLLGENFTTSITALGQLLLGLCLIELTKLSSPILVELGKFGLDIASKVRGLWSSIKESFSYIWTQFKNWWNTNVASIGISIDVPNWLQSKIGIGDLDIHIPKLATGGIVSSSTIANIGEAGPEAVVPLANSNFIKDFAREVASAMNGGTGGTTYNKPIMFDASQFRGLDDSIATRLELGNYFKGCIDLANSY